MVVDVRSYVYTQEIRVLVQGASNVSKGPGVAFGEGCWLVPELGIARSEEG